MSGLLEDGGDEYFAGKKASTSGSGGDGGEKSTTDRSSRRKQQLISYMASQDTGGSLVEGVLGWEDLALSDPVQRAVCLPSLEQCLLLSLRLLNRVLQLEAPFLQLFQTLAARRGSQVVQDTLQLIPGASFSSLSSLEGSISIGGNTVVGSSSSAMQQAAPITAADVQHLSRSLLIDAPELVIWLGKAVEYNQLFPAWGKITSGPPGTVRVDPWTGKVVLGAVAAGQGQQLEQDEDVFLSRQHFGGGGVSRNHPGGAQLSALEEFMRGSATPGAQQEQEQEQQEMMYQLYSAYLPDSNSGIFDPSQVSYHAACIILQLTEIDGNLLCML